MKTKPDLGFWKLWNLSFGFFGVQIAYALQSANVSRIFATIGADPHDLSYFWILPPLMGLLVQPIVGTLSDRTWNRFGRRLPYLIVGAVTAVIVMCLLPNAGSFGLTISGAILMQTMDNRGINAIITFISNAFAGNIIPLTLFPDSVQALIRYQPFAQSLDAPIRMYLHAQAAGEWALNIGVQLLWLMLLVALGRRMWRYQLNQLTIQGG